MDKWLSIPEYSKETGLSRASIQKLIQNGDLIAVKTEGGHQTRIKVQSNPDLEELVKKVEETQALLKGLCEHLGYSEEN